MNQKLHSFVYDYKYSGIVTFLGAVSTLTFGFAMSGVFDTSTLLAGFTTRSELMGQVLTLIIAPSYLATGLIFGQRKSLQLAREVESAGGYQLTEYIETIPVSILVAGSAIGFAYSFLNLPDSALEAETTMSLPMVAIVVAQIFVWMTAGLVLASRLYVSRVLSCR